MSNETPPKSMHFLIVDDDSDSRATIHEYLKEMGHSKFTLASDGVEALRHLDHDPSINFIISDWDMPNVNGLSLLQRVKSTPNRAHLPFLIVTSPISEEAEKVVMAAESLVDGYLIKPFRSQLLKAKIDSILSVPIRGPQKQALVIDDDSDAREMVVEYLKVMGFKDVLGLQDGRDGLEYLLQNHAKVGLIVSDWEMPAMSGIDLLKNCKSNPNLSSIPFLMITSQSSIERMKVLQAAKANVDQYLLKPFTSSDIRQRIEAVVEKARTKGEVDALVNEAMEHLEHSRFQRARMRFEEAIALDETNEVALRGLGDVLIKIKSVDEAIPFYRRAVEANPSNSKGYLKLAAAFDAVGSYDKAVALLQSGISQIGISAEMHFQLGRLYNKKGSVDAAKAEFEKTLEIQLDHQEARLMLAMLKSRRDGL